MIAFTALITEFAPRSAFSSVMRRFPASWAKACVAVSRYGVRRIRRLHGAVVLSVGCSSMDPGHHCWCCDVDGAAPDDHRGVGDCRNHGMLPGWHFGCSVVNEMKQR